jgi:CheY-like chemotaxis protein
VDQCYDVILCDLRMPEMNGITFYRKLCALKPDLSASFVLMTGDDDTELDAFLAQNRQVTVLHKPFSMVALRQHIADLSRDRAAQAALGT